MTVNDRFDWFQVTHIHRKVTNFALKNPKIKILANCFWSTLRNIKMLTNFNLKNPNVDLRTPKIYNKCTNWDLKTKILNSLGGLTRLWEKVRQSGVCEEAEPRRDDRRPVAQLESILASYQDWTRWWRTNTACIRISTTSPTRRYQLESQLAALEWVRIRKLLPADTRQLPNC